MEQFPMDLIIQLKRMSFPTEPSEYSKHPIGDDFTALLLIEPISTLPPADQEEIRYLIGVQGWGTTRADIDFIRAEYVLIERTGKEFSLVDQTFDLTRGIPYTLGHIRQEMTSNAKLNKMLRIKEEDFRPSIKRRRY